MQTVLKSLINRIASFYKSKVHPKLRTGQSYKNFRFNYVFEEPTSQNDVYNNLRINVYAISI